MKSCAIYVRISTDEDLQKWSIPAQTKELQELAERNKISVYKIYIDTISGSLSSRPGLDELRDDMAAGKFSLILVVDQDRLSRLEPIDWELLKKEIREAQVRIITQAQEIDFSNEDSELVSDVFNLFARHQRRKIKKAMRRGRAEAVRNGKWLGKAPYGRILNEDGTLGLDPATVPVVNKIFILYEQGMGAKLIADELKPLPSPGGGEWDHTAILRIITNWAHRGDIVRFENSQEIHVHEAFEPTVPVELFDRCMRILNKKREDLRWFRTRRVTGLAAGLLICGECGRIFNIVPINSKYKGKKYNYYYYRHRVRTKGESAKTSCDCFHRADQVDLRLIECIKMIGANPEAAGHLIRQSNKVSEMESIKKKILSLKKAMKVLEGKRKKLLGLYLEGDWDKASLDDQKRVITAQINTNLREQNEAHGQLKMLEEQKVNLEMIVEYYAALLMIDSEMSREQQRTLIHSLFPKIIIDRDGNLEITAMVPLDNIVDFDGEITELCEAGFYLQGGTKGI